MWTLPGLLGSNPDVTGTEPVIYTDLPINFEPNFTITDPKKYRSRAPVQNPDDPLAYVPLEDPTAINVLASKSIFTSFFSGKTLSDLWAKTELLITPESEGEHIVNQIYGFNPDGTPITPPFIPVPDYNPADLSTPSVIVRAKKAVTDTFANMQATLIKYGVIVVVLLVAGVFLYAFVGAKARKLA
jgi:hypothetical protein